MASLPWRPLYTQSGASSSPVPGEVTAVELYALALTVLFTVSVWALESYLDGRQRDAYLRTEFPLELAETVGRIDEETEGEGKEKGKEKGKGKGRGEEDAEGTSPSSGGAKRGTLAVKGEGEEDEGKDRDKEKDEGGEVEKKENDEDDGDGDGEDEKKKRDSVDRRRPLLPQLRSKFSSAQSYGLDKINFSIVSSDYDTLETVSFLLLGFAPYVWDKSVGLGERWFGWSEGDDEIKVTMIFLALVTAVGTVTALPFELYSTFRIERKHGFNKQTPLLFFTDKIKSLALTVAIGGPFVALLLRIIQWGGDRFYLYVWAFTLCFSVIMMTVVPVFIMPLFNKYEPLKDGSLRDDIFALAGRLKFPLAKLYVVDGSKRSSHSNAYMYGFGSNKRIVLFDTLLEQVRDDEILAILGHELGHWKLGHTLTNFAVTQLYLGAAFYSFSLCFDSRDLYSSFGFDGPDRPVPTIVALTVFFQTVWAPVDKVLSFGLTVHSRSNEFAADRFSSGLGMSEGLRSGLCKIHLENLGAMALDPWYSAYHYSHPPLVERLGAINEFDRKTK